MKLQLLGAKMKKLFRKLLNLFPTPLPRGVVEFETWASDIINDYDLPDNDSLRFALATMVMHGKPTDAYKSKRYFATLVYASMAKQIASHVFTDIKTRQAEASKLVDKSGAPTEVTQ